jgi:hypothetical protein
MGLCERAADLLYVLATSKLGLYWQWALLTWTSLMGVPVRFIWIMTSMSYKNM